MAGVTIDNLSVAYRNGASALLALEQVSLEIKPGRVLALVGESGSGKTTLGKTIMGLTPENALVSGSIRLGDQEIIGLDEGGLNRLRWSRIAMVFQNGAGALNPLHRVMDQITEPLIHLAGLTAALAGKRTEGILARVGLKQSEARRLPHELSGGQIQRALLAMALIMDPEALILDEPTAALDVLTKSFVAGIIRAARDGGKAILLITHDLDLVQTVADEAAVLYQGQIMESLPAPDLLTQPLHPYTLGLGRSFPGMKTTRDLGGICGDALLRTFHLHDDDEEESHAHSHESKAPLRADDGGVHAEGCLFHPRCTQAADRCHQPVALTKSGDHWLRCSRGGLVRLVDLERISKSYGAVPALQPTDLALRAGEVFCLAGETGSGKTTLAMIAAGFLKPDQGTRTFDGRDLDKWMREDYRTFARRIGVIFQNPLESVSHRFNVFDILVEPLKIQGAAGDHDALASRACQALKDVHLPTDEAFLRRFPHELNLGAVQRLCLARALIAGPKLLVADEPTSALDPSVQAKVIKLLLDLQIEKGLTLLMVTHNLGLARKIADRIGVMQAGRLLEVGPAGKVLTRPLHPYTRLLLARSNGEESGDEMEMPEPKGPGCPFAPRCERAKAVCFETFPQWAQGNIFAHRACCHFPLGSENC